MTKMRPSLISTPREIDVELTSQCNLRCRYCYFFDNPDVRYTDLTTEEWLQFFDECGEAGVMRMRLAGGEPFFRSDLKELITGIVTNRMRFSMLSNGGLITDEIAEFIAGTGRCDSIQISLDGGIAEVHETARGKGSFDGAVQGIRILQQYGISVKVRCTIHRLNADHLENCAEFILEQLGLDEFSTNAAGYFGTCQNNAEDLMLTMEDRVKVMQTLDRLCSKYPGRITASAGPLANLISWRAMETARKQNLPRYSNTGALTGCGCHNIKLSVRSDGHFAVCDMLAGISLGRINTDALLDVWQNNPILSKFRNRHTTDLSTFEYCRDCEYVDYCTGNCPATTYSLTGQVHQPAPDSCYKLFLQQDGYLPTSAHRKDIC